MTLNTQTHLPPNVEKAMTKEFLDALLQECLNNEYLKKALTCTHELDTSSVAFHNAFIKTLEKTNNKIIGDFYYDKKIANKRYLGADIQLLMKQYILLPTVNKEN